MRFERGSPENAVDLFWCCKLGILTMSHIKAGALAIAAGACFFFFWLGSFILSWVVLPLVHLALRHRPPLERVRRCQDIVGHAFRLFIAGMRNLRVLVFRPRAVKLDLPEGPFVMIANHPTLIDVTAIMGIHPRICCVAKTELFESALVGPLLRSCGHIEGGSGTLTDGAIVIGQAEERLKHGQPVLIFPEGTRSPAGGLGRFKPGAFEIALRAGVPIVQLLLTCEPATLMKGLTWYRLPKKTAMYNLTQLPTVRPDVLSGGASAGAEQFHGRYRSMIESGRAQPGSNPLTASALSSTAEPRKKPASESCKISSSS